MAPLAHHSQNVIAGPRVQSAVKSFLAHHPTVTMTSLARACNLTQSAVCNIVQGVHGDVRVTTVDKLKRGMKTLRAKAV
jgi:hypothetical protein